MNISKIIKIYKSTFEVLIVAVENDNLNFEQQQTTKDRAQSATRSNHWLVQNAKKPRVSEAGSKILGAGVNLRPSGYEPDELPGLSEPKNRK